MLDENGAPVYNTVQDILKSAMAECVAFLDNYTGANDTMHRQRVKVADGQYKWVQGKTHDELNDAIVRTYVESGRISEFLGDSYQKPKGYTNFKSYAENWFSTYKTSLKPMSQRDYRYQLDHILYPVFGDGNLQDITTQDVQVFLNGHSNVARSTLRKSLLVLKQLFKLAIKEKLVDDNPVDTKLLKIASETENEREPLSPEEFADVEAHVPCLRNKEDQMLIAAMMYTGMRRGEVLGLKWEDIDFSARIITVQRNVTYPDNDAVVGTPKSKKGFRTVPLDDRLAVYLNPRKSEGYLFGRDKPPSKSSFTKRWNRIKEAIDLHGATPHVFRHTYATMLNNAGVSMKTIQVILGHADITTTMNIYTHTDVENILEAGIKYKQFSTQTTCTTSGNVAQL